MKSVWRQEAAASENPLGLVDCQRHRSSPTHVRMLHEAKAHVSTQQRIGASLTHSLQVKFSFPGQLSLGQTGVGITRGHVSVPAGGDFVGDLQRPGGSAVQRKRFPLLR